MPGYQPRGDVVATSDVDACGWFSCACEPDPQQWLGSAVGIDLGAPGLSDRLTTLMPRPLDERSCAVVLFQHVSALPFEVADASLRTLPHALHLLPSGDAYFKATLLVHLLRLSGIPARMRWVEMESRRMAWGLWDFLGHSGMPLFYPLTEIWLDGHWWTTDAYVMDPPLCQAAQRELRRRGRSSGYFVHVDGACDWDGQSHALQRFHAQDRESWPLRDLGCFHSHGDFLASSQERVPETDVTRMAYSHQARTMSEAFARLRETG